MSIHINQTRVHHKPLARSNFNNKYKKHYIKKNENYKNEYENDNSHNHNTDHENILIFQNNIIINNESTYYNEISIDTFIININNISSTSNIIEISNSINLETPLLISYAASESINFKNALRGDNTSFICKYIIDKVKCDINPIINSNLRKSIATIKWKLYDFMIKRNEKMKKSTDPVDYDSDIIKWIAMLAGVYLYFSEKDELNLKQTSLLKEVCRPFTIHSFK